MKLQTLIDAMAQGRHSTKAILCLSSLLGSVHVRAYHYDKGGPVELPDGRTAFLEGRTTDLLDGMLDDITEEQVSEAVKTLEAL